MIYLCIGYHDAARFDALEPAEHAAIDAARAPHDAALRASGRLRQYATLRRATTATLRPSRDGTLISDGPLADTGLRIDAVFLIEARDLNEAIRVASLHPAARVGGAGFALEVRPIDALHGTA